jgi:hypothetical protein
MFVWHDGMMFMHTFLKWLRLLLLKRHGHLSLDCVPFQILKRQGDLRICAVFGQDDGRTVLGQVEIARRGILVDLEGCAGGEQQTATYYGF